jgi:hypothetical protein
MLSPKMAQALNKKQEEEAKLRIMFDQLDADGTAHFWPAGARF